VRTAFFLLLFLNVIFLAWARWIDTPQEVRPTASLSTLPPLTLSKDATAATGGPAGEAGGDGSRPRIVQCVSLGPFNDLTRAARSAVALRAKGLDPQQRAEEGEARDGYWVFIGDIESDVQQAAVLRSLEQASITDAQPMPRTEEDGRRVSVGLFSDRGRAERRAKAVSRLGFKADITERRRTGTFYWIDVDLAQAPTRLSEDDLRPKDMPAAQWELKPCPEPAAEAPPAVPDTAEAEGSPRSALGYNPRPSSMPA